MIPSGDIKARVEMMTDWAEQDLERGRHFVYIRIPQQFSPFERGDLYEDPLGKVLAEAKAGEVTGGGTQLGDGGYSGVDVSLTDYARGLKLLITELRRIGAPAGTVIEDFTPEFQEHPVYDA